MSHSQQPIAPDLSDNARRSDNFWSSASARFALANIFGDA